MMRKGKIDKVKVLKDIVKGKISVDQFSPAKSFIVTIKENETLITVSGAALPQELKLTEDQYNTFKSKLRPQDILFELNLCDFSGKEKQEQLQLPSPAKRVRYIEQAGNEPLSSENDLEAQYRQESKLLPQDESTPIKEKKKAKKKPAKNNELPIIEMKQSGLLSEYGLTWKASFSND